MHKFCTSAFAVLLFGGAMLMLTVGEANASGYAIANFEGGVTCTTQPGADCGEQAT